MVLRKWAFFYFSPGFHPYKNMAISRNSNESCEFISVGFDMLNKDEKLIIDTAIKLKNEGIQMIELCGGFGPTWVTKLMNALDSTIPVGSVYYGPEFRRNLTSITGG